MALTLPAAAQAPAPASQDSEALRLLRETIEAQKKNPDKVIHNFTSTNPPALQPAKRALTPSEAAAAELEQRYLAGKLSQRDYEKGLARLRLGSPAANNTASKNAVATSPKASSGPPPALEPAFTTPPPQPTERQKKISDVESRLDDMIRSKEARERTALTNEVKVEPGKKLTKRERLDFLLRQVVQGKLSDEEYKKERERILAEPD